MPPPGVNDSLRRGAVVPETGAVVLDDVSIRLGNYPAVDGLTLRVETGEIFGLLGPNGSGKSSTLAAIAGVLETHSGSIRVGGHLQKDHPAEYARFIGYSAQQPALYDELSAHANLDFIACLYDLPRQRRRLRIAHVLDQVGLTHRARERVGTYSGGMQRRLHLAASLLHEPAVLLLDEPSVALDAESRDVLFRVVTAYRDEGRTVVFSTHLLDEAEEWCDRVAVLTRGRLTAYGSPADVLHSHTTKQVLLGILQAELTEQAEVALRRRFDHDVVFRIDARRIRLEAADLEQLGQALTLLGAEGIEVVSWHTPVARLDHVAETVFPDGVEGEACFAS